MTNRITLDKGLEATNQSELVLTARERKAIDLWRNVNYGRILIFIENNEPVRAEQIIESIKF